MSLGRLGQCEPGADPHVELAGGDPGEQLVGAAFELGALGDVVEQRRAGEEQRAVGGQRERRDRIDRSGRVAERRHHPSRAEQREAGVEHRLADAVVHHVERARPGDLGDRLGEVDVAVEDHVIGAGGARELGLLGGSDRGEHLGAQALGDLDQEQADAAGTGVDETAAARREWIGVGGEVVGGHALERDGSGHVEVDDVGHAHDPVGGRHDGRGVRARTAGPRHPVTGRETVDTGAGRHDGAGALQARDVRQRHLVEPGTLVGVDEVDP